MLLGADLGHAFRSLLRTPVRSFLVLQGIAWAVGIAIFPAAVLQGSRAAALTRAAEVGTGRVSLLAEPGARPLTLEDASALRRGIPGYQPFVVAPVRVARLKSEPGAPVHLLGTDASGADVRYQKAARGRYLEERDLAPGAPPVCVLEPLAAEALFPGSDPLGRKVALGEGREAEVVGLLAPRSERALKTDDFGLEIDHRMQARVWAMLTAFGVLRPDDAWKRSERCVHVPVGLLPREGEAVDWILVRTTPSEAPALADALRNALVARGAASTAYANLVWPVLASETIDRYMRLKDALVLACLAMGGIVIANVMLLSLLERTREIAIRRAEGATRADIAAQFLAEAGVLGVTGSLLGLPLGMGLAWVRIQFVPYSLFTFSFPGPTAAAAAAVGIVTAVLAGVLPARRAARLDPAAALREL
jgi:putative ABC transport system permease protein